MPNVAVVRRRAIIMPPFMRNSGSLSRFVRVVGFALLSASVGRSFAQNAPLPESCPDLRAALDATDRPGATITPAPPSTPKAELGDIEISSDEAIVGVGGDAALKGDVRVREGDRELRAEDVQYESNGQAFKAVGGLEYTDPQVRVKGSGGGSYSATGGADFSAAEFELRERSARGAADRMQLTPAGVIHLVGVRFTTCPRNDTAWQLRAEEITLDTSTQLGTGRGARVDFKGVPIIYLPWLSFPLGTQRKSGFLFPSLGHSQRSGAQLVVPYYWNIAPNMDFTFEPALYARRGVDVAGQFRYLTGTQRGTLSMNYLPSDRLADQDRSRFRLEHVSNLPHELRFVIDAENVSDPFYFEDFAQGQEGTSTPFVERLARLTYRDEHWRFAGEMQDFQTIDRDLLPIDRPYARVPRLVANADFGWGPAERFRYGFDSEVVNFDRSIGVTGWRADLMPTASLDLSGAGYFLRPGFAWRHTSYALDDVAPGEDTSRSRTLPIGSVDAGLIFEREAGSHGQRRVTLEPRLLYLNVPFRNQDDLPIFDTGLPDLNLVQLFRTNRFVGADRVSDADQLSVGVTSRLFDADSGTQYLAATLGQTYYFDSPRVRLPDEPPGGRNSSDVIAQLALTAYKNWNADLGLQWNPDQGRSERAQVNLQYVPGPEKVINVGYRFQRERLEQAEVSSAWPIGQRWAAFGRLVHSFEDSKTLERFAGLEYRSCCWRLRFLGRRFVSSRTGEQDTGFYVQLELTGLASVGSAADSFLATAIRGYSRTEPNR
jgi:LPS-assembly protein